MPATAAGSSTPSARAWSMARPETPMVLEQVENRLPLDACRFHCDVGYATVQQPLPQQNQVIGHRSECPGLDAVWCKSANHHRLFVDIQPTAPLVDRPHPAPPPNGLSSGRRPDQ